MTRDIKTYLGRPAFYVIVFSAALIAVNLFISNKALRAQAEVLAQKERRVAALRDYLKGKREGVRLDEAYLIEEALLGVEAFKKGLPDSRRLTTVLNDVLKLAKKNGLRIPSADYSPETIKDSGFSRYTISFPVEGGYGRIKRFIYDVEAMRHAVVIDDITLASGRAGTGTIGLKIRISVYYI